MNSPTLVDSLILTIRGQKVLLDADLASIYGVPTKRLNEQVKRNVERFPEDFVWQLTNADIALLKSQIATSNKQVNIPTYRGAMWSQIATSKWGGRRTFPRAFTEHGALMAANVLNRPEAVKMSVHVVRAFIKQRELIAGQAEILKKLAQMDAKLLKHDDILRVIWKELQPLLATSAKASSNGALISQRLPCHGFLSAWRGRWRFSRGRGIPTPFSAVRAAGCAEGSQEWSTVGGLLGVGASGGLQVFADPPTHRPKASALTAPFGSQPQRTEPLSIVSLVLGICSIFIFFLSIPAVICGHLARRRIKAHPTLSGEGMALAGLTTGYISIVLYVVIAATVFFTSLYALGGAVDAAESQRAAVDLNTLSTALGMYKVVTGGLPTTEQGLDVLVKPPTTGPIPERYRVILDELPKDPWGKPYQYRRPGKNAHQSYNLFSLGKDGVESEDDIGNN